MSREMELAEIRAARFCIEGMLEKVATPPLKPNNPHQASELMALAAVSNAHATIALAEATSRLADNVGALYVDLKKK